MEKTLQKFVESVLDLGKQLTCLEEIWLNSVTLQWGHFNPEGS